MAERSKLAVKPRKSPKPKGPAPSAVELQVKKLFGLEPNQRRLTLLPDVNYSKRGGLEFTAPQFLYDIARAFSAPGVALSGQPIDAESEAANIAMNFTGAGSVANRVGRRAFAVDRNVLGMSGSPKPKAPKPKPTAPKPPKPTIRALQDIRPSPDDVYQVMDANTSSGKVTGNKMVPIAKLVGGVSNAADDKKRVDALVDAMKSPEGYIARLIVDHSGNVIEGQHRLEALRKLGVKEVPVTEYIDLEEAVPFYEMKDAAQKAQSIHPDHAYQIANRLAEIYADENGNLSNLADYIPPEGFENAWNAAVKTLTEANAPANPSPFSIKRDAPRFAPASQEPVVSQAGRMGVPVIGREQMAVQHPSKFGPYATIKPRRPENEVEITREPSVEMAPSEVFDVEKLQNALVVPLYGDKSIAGERITSINGTPVSVETYGGPRYGALNAAVGSPSGWASELPQISALRNQIRGGLEQGRDVYGVYTAMSPRAADQTTMMADALLQQAQQAPIRKADIKAFDEAARQIIPNFAGLTHPEAYQQLLSAKQGQRKSLVELMDTAKALEAGLPDVSATRMALTTPELMYAPGGSTGFQVVKFGPESLEPVDVSLVHPTYGTQMAGTPVGHFEQQIPFDLLYPDLIKERRALGLSPGKDLRSFEFRKPTQVVDQETLDLIKKYLQDIQGAE